MEQAKQILSDLEMNVLENCKEEQTMFEWLQEYGTRGESKVFVIVNLTYKSRKSERIKNK